MKRFTLTCLLATVACLGLASKSQAEEKVASYYVTYNELNGQTLLEDNDKIKITPVADISPFDQSKIEIRLRTNKDMWWKGVMLYNSQTKELERVVELTQGGDNEHASAALDFSDFAGKTLVLSKAKAFGIRSNVYQVRDAATHMKGGKVYEIKWVKDW